MSLEAGTAPGPYEVLVKIGEGGMGEVYRARDTMLHRDVALRCKLMRPALGLTALVFTVAILVGGQAVAQPATEEEGLVRLVVDGQAIPLSDDLRATLRRHADAIVRSCSYDAGYQDERVWRKARAEASSIRLVYPTPITIRLPRRELVVSEATFSLSDPTFMGQPLLHHDGRTMLVAKCDGTEMLRLMCHPELATYFPPGYQRSCHRE